MKLKQQIEHVRKWCESNNISIFESEVSSDYPIIQWKEINSGESLQII